MGKGGRSKNKSQRSSSSLPKGIPHKRSRGGGIGGGLAVNPFETARSTNSALRVKHPVHNKSVPGQQQQQQQQQTSSAGFQLQSSLAKSIARRRQHLSHQLSNEGKANVFIDRRIGEAHHHHTNIDNTTNQEDVMLKRIVQERVRRSKKRDKFHLTDDDDHDHHDNAANYYHNNGLSLTHRGQTIDEHYTGAPMDHHDVLLSDEDDEDLDKVDTMLHFGGGKFDSENRKERGAYATTTSTTVGGVGGAGELGQVYRSRRTELEDRIQMKKMLKAEKLKRKEDQAGTFETMDESFAELAQLLNFRDKEQERIQRSNDRKNGKLSVEDVEMDDWDKEMKEYLFTKKVKATDRTRTPEELAKEQAMKLHALESKRLARMAGDFLSEDEFSDISDDDEGDSSGRRKKKRRRHDKKENGKRKSSKTRESDHHVNPEELSDSDNEDEDNDDAEGNASGKRREVRFTADGLVYVDKQGRVLGKVGDEEEEEDDGKNDEIDSDGEGSDNDSDEDEEDSSEDDIDRHNLGDTDDEASAAADDDDDDVTNHATVELKVGMAIQGNYHADEQLDNKGNNWFNGTITSVRKAKDGQAVVYDITYDDGDYEEGMSAENVRPLIKSEEETKRDEKMRTEVEIAKHKKQKAKLRAK